MEYKKEYYAKVHSMESFGTVDGPGIRFILFLQGCNLKCKYCQNRDTWNMNLGELKSMQEIFEKILRYKNYISGKGGVTVSGGEPLLQVDFLIKLFEKLKKENIHTCIDTSGMVKITENMKRLIEFTDLFLLDIKHIDSKKCEELVGTTNKYEIEFAKYLSKIGKHMWIRQVIIPGITDDENDLLNLGKFISSLKTVDRVEFLPYHNLGQYKWKNLGFEYEFENIRVATDDDIKKAENIIKKVYKNG